MCNRQGSVQQQQVLTYHNGSGLCYLAHVLICLHYLLYTSCQGVPFAAHLVLLIPEDVQS